MDTDRDMLPSYLSMEYILEEVSKIKIKSWVDYVQSAEIKLCKWM